MFLSKIFKEKIFIKVDSYGGVKGTLKRRVGVVENFLGEDLIKGILGNN